MPVGNKTYSPYNLRAITPYLSEFSLEAPDNAPFLPAGLVNTNCCVSYFREYHLNKPASTYAQKQLSLPDGSYILCPSGYEQLNIPQTMVGGYYIAYDNNDIGENSPAEILVYPGCTVSLRVVGKQYFVPYFNIISDGNIYAPDYINYNTFGAISFNVAVVETPFPYWEIESDGSSKYPLTQGPDSECCTSLDMDEGTFDWQSSDGLDWFNTVSWFGNYSVFGQVQAGILDEDCYLSTFYSLNSGPFPPPWETDDAFGRESLYSGCYNQTLYPVVDFPGGAKRRVYNLVAMFPFTPSWYCCRGTLTTPPDVERSYPKVACEYDESGCCCPGADPFDCEGLAPCPCFENAHANPCGNYKNINLEFIYENKTDCVARLAFYNMQMSFDLPSQMNTQNYQYSNACEGSDLRLEIQVLNGPPGCAPS